MLPILPVFTFLTIFRRKRERKERFSIFDVKKSERPMFPKLRFLVHLDGLCKLVALQRLKQMYGMYISGGRKTMDAKTVPQNRLCTFYQDYLITQDSSLFVRLVGAFYSQPTLLRLATSSHPVSRRAAAVALTYLGDYRANHVFGRMLHDDDQTVRLLAEIGIKNLWPRDGDDRHRNRLRTIMRLNTAEQFQEAIHQTDSLLDEFPEYAEAWNQRGIANFGLKKYEDMIEDAYATLNLNPFHFGAATGMGHAYLQLRDWMTAIDCYQLALEINPNLKTLRETIAKISGEWKVKLH